MITGDYFFWLIQEEKGESGMYGVNENAGIKVCRIYI